MQNDLNKSVLKGVPTNNAVKKAQQKRLRRFGMALITYAVAILATSLGLGELSTGQWIKLIGLCLLGNSLFFVLFYTNTNLRFSEPSLTREQIVFSSFYGIVAMYWLPEARPIILLFFLPPFSFGMLSLTFRQYLNVVVWVMGVYAALLGLEYFQSPQEFKIQYQLFLFVLFGLVLTWFAFFGGFVSNIRHRLMVQKEDMKNANKKIKIEMEERKRAQIEKDNLIIELKNVLDEVKTLSGLLPICASCKKIRDDKGYWNNLEEYIQTYSDVSFSHGMCSECSDKLYGKEDWYIEMKNEESQEE